MGFHRSTLAVLLLWTRLGHSQPVADHHQHLFHGAPTPPPGLPLTASDLISLLDASGIRRAAVLSIAYQLGNPNRPAVENEYTRVKSENDWTSAQVALYPKRLVAFCSVNPLKDYALAEIARCGKDVRLRKGLKLHFGNSDVNLLDNDHIAQLRRVFHAADRNRMAIIVHMRSTVSKQRPYGSEQARRFLEQVLPAAPHVPVQIAHLSGAGGFDDPAVDQALGVFIAAIARHDPRMKRVYFDISGVLLGQWRAKKELIAQRVREVGLSRILYGSDALPAHVFAAFHQLPLTAAEFRTIENNVAPYLK